jgi:hypothetical protein
VSRRVPSYGRWVDDAAKPPRLFPNRWADAVGPGDLLAGHDRCECFDQVTVQAADRDVFFHGDQQDTSAPGWQHLLTLIDEAAADGREEFRPLVEMSPQERRQVITVPPTIGKLTAVKHLVLYRSNLVRLPPEIGAMTSLEGFSPYTSARLHWFPYELTRCRNLVHSTVSTRAVFGNYKHRPPFPELRHGPLPSGDLDPGVWGAAFIRTCSVCAGPITERGVRQVWLSARVATDVLPLLVNACSDACVEALPPGAQGYIPAAQGGGRAAVQPAHSLSPPRGG